ncbi:MAG TPA: ribose-phosphate diphosphokinase [Gemmatimonadales bacterium]|nr:ribose-phosphate diphosphokinase [Gemmatimonadales bacterium]
MIVHSAENSLIAALPGSERLGTDLAERLGGRRQLVEMRRFPDGESYVRINGQLRDTPLVIVGPLDRPDEKLLPLLLLAATARELGATEVGLVAPYLAYLRQDRRFRPGEAVSAVHFARLLSDRFDWVVTIEPHLHRLRNLGDIYQVPARAVSAGRLIAAWIRANVQRPVIIGPDEESRQWVEPVAAAADAPFIVVRKCRVGDFHVEVSLPDLAAFRDRTPVVLDDIISTGGTVEQIVRMLVGAGFPAPASIAVHGIFAGDAYERIVNAGAKVIVTCNTIPHVSNAIDVTAHLAAAARAMLERTAEGWNERASPSAIAVEQ